MGDDADWHELPFAFPVTEYANLAEGSNTAPSPHHIYTIIVQGFLLRFCIVMSRWEGRMWVGFCCGSRPPLRGLAIQFPYLRVLCCLTGRRYRLMLEPHNWILYVDVPPVADLYLPFPTALNPLPQPFHHYTLTGSIGFRVVGNLLELSSLVFPPFPFPVNRLGSLMYRQVESGLSGLPSQGRVEIRCMDNRSLYILNNHIHLFSGPSQFLQEALGRGQSWLSLESYSVSVVGQSLEALLHGWFRDLDLDWVSLERVAYLFLRRRIAWPWMAAQLRGQLERDLLFGLGAEPSAKEALQAITLASLADFKLLYNRGLAVLVLAPDYQAWAFFGGCLRPPLFNLMLRINSDITRVHTRPRPD